MSGEEMREMMLQPFQLGSLTLPNRVVMTPLSWDMAQEREK
jgi:2,4-dienoyl-CoA reductase-like NADH-dependent reductase (Old Yellow Enzyme family)